MMTGHPHLREKLSEHFSKYFKNGLQNRDINPNSEVLVTCGAMGALQSALMNLVGPGDEVLMFEPYFTSYCSHIEFSGAEIKTAPMYVDENREWQHNWEAFEKEITDKTKVVLITNPHNPTGKLWTQPDIERLSSILEKHPKIKVISDDVYYFLPFDQRKYITFADHSPENWAKTLNIFSAGKLLNCTGWKIGWAIGPSDLLRRATQVHEASTFNVNVPG